MSKLAKAIELAAQVHRDQIDMAGDPYILHPLEVLRRVRLETKETIPARREEVLCVAVLHDVLEDFDGPAEDHSRLRNFIYEEFGGRVLTAVETLTRHRIQEDEQLGIKAWTEPYDKYIERVCQDWMARRVKLADLATNMDLRRMPLKRGITKRDLKRWDKYRRAYVRLLEEEGRMS